VRFPSSRQAAWMLLQPEKLNDEQQFTVEWSNGQLEGQVNRWKLIKRQMYGRAKFDLLSARVLHSM
jgi:transposase